MKAVPIVLAAVIGATAWAQPSISFAENAASNIPPGLPNAAIAQGAMFVLKGTKMGPADVVVASTFPLSTNLAGASVQVTVSGQTLDCIVYYAMDRQVAAILPSSTPLGTGTVTVTFNGQTSAPARITVVANNIAMYTLDSSGAGPVAATFADGFVSPTNAARPGDAVVLWANGLGPVTSDETQPAVQADQPDVPLEVYIGGKQANIVYRGRNSCCSSVDTVSVIVPDGVAGCVTPVTMKIGSMVSNTASIPVASNGRNCSLTIPGVSDGDLQRLLAKGTISTGGINVARSVITTVGGTSLSDLGGASFLMFNLGAPSGFASGFDVATYGSCTVSSYTGQSGAPPTTAFQSLDAGSAIHISGPAGVRNLAKQNTSGVISYNAAIGNGTAGNYLDPGSYSFTGPGGLDVGQFCGQSTLPPQLIWTNQAAITTVNRANGVMVTWTGGDPAGYVQIAGTSFVTTNGTDTVGASFLCTARTGDLSFAVPAMVLQALPASGTKPGFAFPGSLSVYGRSGITQFQADGIDLGMVSSSSINVNTSIMYQ